MDPEYGKHVKFSVSQRVKSLILEKYTNFVTYAMIHPLYPQEQTFRVTTVFKLPLVDAIV